MSREHHRRDSRASSEATISISIKNENQIMKSLCLADKPCNGRVAIDETIVNTAVLDDSFLNPRRDCDCWDTKIYMREIRKLFAMLSN